MCMTVSKLCELSVEPCVVIVDVCLLVVARVYCGSLWRGRERASDACGVLVRARCVHVSPARSCALRDLRRGQCCGCVLCVPLRVCAWYLVVYVHRIGEKSCRYCCDAPSLPALHCLYGCRAHEAGECLSVMRARWQCAQGRCRWMYVDRYVLTALVLR